MEYSSPLVKVTSPSFSKNTLLAEETYKYFPRAVLNRAGKEYTCHELADYLNDADAAIIGLDTVDDALLASTPRLKFIAKYGVGLDNIDQEACAHRGIALGFTPGVNKRSVSEQVLASMIGLCRNVYQSSYQLKQGVWNKAGGVQLSGKTVGIIGVGNVGKDLVSLLAPFRCTLLANDIVEQTAYYQEHGIREASKEEIYKESDVITLHVPLTPHTKYLINAASLALMKRTAFLINTSRGKVVEQEALKRALKEKTIAGAALDVYESEPPQDTEFLTLPNLLCTPHIGGSSLEGITAMGLSALRHLREHFKTSRIS